jgi:hypothetical protein
MTLLPGTFLRILFSAILNVQAILLIQVLLIQWVAAPQDQIRCW